MTFAKKDLFDTDLQKLSQYFKVLGHPARLAILKYLAEKKTCFSGDISNEIPLSRTTVFQHLQELKKVGLIHGEIDGVKVNYCICSDITSPITKKLIEFLELINVDVNCKI